MGVDLELLDMEHLMCLSSLSIMWTRDKLSMESRGAEHAWSMLNAL